MFEQQYKSVYELIFEAGETCDWCNQPFDCIEDMRQVGDLFVHKFCSMKIKIPK